MAHSLQKSEHHKLTSPLNKVSTGVNEVALSGLLFN